ncbi:hypothetical protein B0H11DRAFT_2270974 [Mycena galericulata]|nr:hypothetical protein B0H11DRAFT_2270974 [Mycena galericulata]
MLARFSAASSQVEFSDSRDEHLILDMDLFRVVLPVPDITWGRVAKLCERAMNPMYKGLYSILEQDMEHVAQVLAALELAALEQHGSEQSQRPRPSDAKTSTTPDENLAPDTLMIKSPHPSIPIIVVTPCPRQPRETSCQVPYQDSAFRNQLTVPSHPSFNHSFPPMIPPRRVSSCGMNWTWKNGHWQAALGGLEPRPRMLKHKKRSRPNSNQMKTTRG